MQKNNLRLAETVELMEKALNKNLVLQKFGTWYGVHKADVVATGSNHCLGYALTPYEALKEALNNDNLE